MQLTAKMPTSYVQLSQRHQTPREHNSICQSSKDWSTPGYRQGRF